MKKYIKFLIVIPAILLLSIANLSSQYGSFGTTDAQSIGMGNSFGAAYNTLSVGINPAFLAYPKDTLPRITIQLPVVSGKGLISAMSMDDFNTYFDNPKSKNLSDAEKAEFYNAFESEPGAYADGGFSFAVSWMHSKEIGTFGLSRSYYLSASSNIPLELIDLVLNGNEENKTYSLNNFSFKTWILQATTLSYAREIMEFEDESIIKNLTGGISLKLISGYNYLGIEEMESSIHTGEYNALTGKTHIRALMANSPDMGGKFDFEEDGYTSNPGLFMDPAGAGFGVDIGFAADLNNGLQVGLSITDIGSVNWDTRAGEYLIDGNLNIDDLFDKDQRDDLENSTSDTSYAVGSFSTSLPTALRLSFAYNLVKAIESIPGELLVGLDYHQGFNDMPGNRTSPRFAFGARWKTSPSIPVVCTGFTNDMAGNLRWAFGFGWSTSLIDINFATQDLLTLLGGSGSPFISAGMNIIWKIQY